MAEWIRNLGIDMASAKQVLMVNPVITFIPIARINVVLPDILEPVNKTDLSETVIELGTQLDING